MTPSITTFSRLEPSPRSNSIDSTLSARIRDPLWMLTRQWQFGEFQGADSGSPAWVQVVSRETSVVGWRVEGSSLQTLPPGIPLESPVEHEGISPDDLAVQVELG